MSYFNSPTKKGILYSKDDSNNMEIGGNIGDAIYSPYNGTVEITDQNKSESRGDQCRGLVIISHDYDNQKIYSKFCYIDNVSVQPGMPVYNDTKIGELGRKNIVYSVMNASGSKYRVNLNGTIEYNTKKDDKKLSSDKKYQTSSPEYKSDDSYNKKTSSDYERGKYDYSLIPLQAILSPLAIFDLLTKKGGRELAKNKIISHYKRQGYRVGKPKKYIDETGNMTINLKTKHPDVFKSNYYMHKDLDVEKARIVKSYKEDGFSRTYSNETDKNEYILINLREKHPNIFDNDYFMKKKIPTKGFLHKKGDEIGDKIGAGIEDIKNKGSEIIFGKKEQEPKDETENEFSQTTTTTLNPTVTENIDRIKYLIESFTKK